MAREVFRRTGWLSHEPAEFRETVTSSAKLKRFEANTPIYHQGDASSGIFGVVSGFVKIEAVQDDGRSLTLGIMLEGEWFGELSTIERSARPNSAIALMDTVAMQIPPDLYVQIIERNPRHMASFTNLVTDKVSRLSWLRQELTAPDPRRRVRNTLLSLSNVRDWADLQQEVAIPITQGQIANLANLSRQTVNAVLKELSSSGLIECRYGAVILIPPKRRA